MTTCCNTTLDKAPLNTDRKNTVARILFIRKVNAFLAKVGKAMSLAGAIYTK